MDCWCGLLVRVVGVGGVVDEVEDEGYDREV